MTTLCERCLKPGRLRGVVCAACNRKEAEAGKALLALYVMRHGVNKTEAKEPYMVTDAITALLMHARARRLDVGEILASARKHYEQETDSMQEEK